MINRISGKTSFLARLGIPIFLLLGSTLLVPTSSEQATMTFGQMLKRLRKRLDRTQHEMATYLGTSESMVAKIEGDKRPPPLKAEFYSRLTTIPGIEQEELDELLAVAPRVLRAPVRSLEGQTCMSNSAPEKETVLRIRQEVLQEALADLIRQEELADLPPVQLEVFLKALGQGLIALANTVREQDVDHESVDVKTYMPQPIRADRAEEQNDGFAATRN